MPPYRLVDAHSGLHLKRESAKVKMFVNFDQTVFYNKSKHINIGNTLLPDYKININAYSQLYQNIAK